MLISDCLFNNIKINDGDEKDFGGYVVECKEGKMTGRNKEDQCEGRYVIKLLKYLFYLFFIQTSKCFLKPFYLNLFLIPTHSD